MEVKRVGAEIATKELDTLDTLGEQRALHMIGNSLAGAIALQLLVLDPRVASLALVNSAGFESRGRGELMIPLPKVRGRETRRETRPMPLPAPVTNTEGMCVSE